MVLLSCRNLYRARQLRSQFPAKKSPNSPMHGLIPYKHPVTHTTKYLNAGIEFRDCVKCVTIHYSEFDDSERQAEHKSVKELVDYNFTQLQYKNPDVQLLVLKNMLPSPFLTFFLDDGDKFHIDANGKSHIELLRYIQKIIGKPRELIEIENKAVMPNQANFGEGFARDSLTDVQGQMPHSGRYMEFTEEARKKLQGRNQNINKRWRAQEDMDD